MQKSMWWYFLLAFALLIGGIQSLGWWTRPAAAQSPVSPTSSDPFSTAAARRHLHGQPAHWRDLLMQK